MTDDRMQTTDDGWQMTKDSTEDSRLSLVIGLLSSVFCLLFFAGCSKKTHQEPPVPVETAQVTLETVPIEVGSFGTVEPNVSAMIKSQVAGILTAVHFTEGQEVKKDDLLVSIDSRSFDAALKVAQGNLEKDKAQLLNAQKEADRQSELFKKGFASQDEYDKTVTAAQALKATVDSDMAAVEQAKLQVDYCSIRSPIDGIVGSLYVDVGNLIKEKDVAITSINQICPIKISFTLPQQYLPAIQKYMAQSALGVIVKVPNDQEQQTVTGELLFIDNAVDTASGTIKLWAQSTNDKRILWPGQFVNVVLVLTQEPNVPVVPSQAIQNGQQGQFVYVVSPDNTAEIRQVTVKRTMNGSSVVEGLTAGQTVVTDGQLRLVPGAKVQIKQELPVSPDSNQAGYGGEVKQ